MPNDKFSTTGPDNSTNHESKDNQPVAPLSASSRPLEQKPADIILPTLDADLNIDVDPNKRSTVATVLEKYNPNAPEENQQPAVAAALTALESHRVASRIDKKSLAANDDLDKCNDALRRGNCPTENYPSNVGYYGFDVQHGEEVSTYTQSGMGRLMLGLEDWFYKKRDGGALLGKSIRRKISGKGFGEKILDRAKELGQGERFRLDEDGNLTEKNDDMRSGMLLDDLLRFGKRTEPEYQFLRDHAGEIDRALELTAQMIAQTHRTSGKGIGEVLCNDIVLKVEDGKIKSKMAAYTLIAIGRILKDKARVILVSGGITADTAFKIGFLWAGSQGEAIKKAKEFFAKKPKIIFLKRACEILPVMD